VAIFEARLLSDHKRLGRSRTANAFESVRGAFTRSIQAAMIAVHASDEYEQIVEFLRMNGIVRLASRR
jgi:hypothetical protein